MQVSFHVQVSLIVHNVKRAPKTIIRFKISRDRKSSKSEREFFHSNEKKKRKKKKNENLREDFDKKTTLLSFLVCQLENSSSLCVASAFHTK